MRHAAAVPAWIRALKPAPLRYHAAASLGRGHPAKTPRAVIAGLLAADFAFAFQQTAVVPAIHSVEQSLGASREWSAWLITVYLIVATIATPAMPISRISRSTVHRATSIPSRRNCSHTFRAPYNRRPFRRFSHTRMICSFSCPSRASRADGSRSRFFTA